MPKKTIKRITNKTILLRSSKYCFDISSGQLLFRRTLLEKNNPSDEKANKANKLSKKTPLEGSDANECTLFRIPDLTMNDPKIDRRKVLIPRNTIQDRSILFLL